MHYFIGEKGLAIISPSENSNAEKAYIKMLNYLAFDRPNAKTLKNTVLKTPHPRAFASAEQFEQVIAPGGALEALQEAKRAGKIGHIGFTTHSTELFEKALETDWVETIMFPYNIVETQGEELIRRCAEKNIGFIVMKPLAGGAIEDATVALRYIAANPAVSVIIPGMADVSEFTQNLAAVNNTSPLSPAELSEIESIRTQLGTQFCRRCGYCAPCTVGISIPSMFLFEGYLERYGLADWARGRYETLAKTASDCIGCGVCETRCPYNLPIRQMLKHTAEAFGK
jgi:predicted aldo/keto reductase-like oxidoreductase